MSTFAEQTFERITAQYADADVGASALYGVIASLIRQGHNETACAIATESYIIHRDDDSFIVEDQTTFTQVFLEVFKRVFFTHREGMTAEELRQNVLLGGGILTDVAMQL